MSDFDLKNLTTNKKEIDNCKKAIMYNRSYMNYIYVHYNLIIHHFLLLTFRGVSYDTLLNYLS